MILRPLIIAAGLLTTLGAMAQTTNSTDTPAPNSQQVRPLQKMHDMMMKRHAWHLETLKTNLKLLPEQESQWATFTASMKPQHREALHKTMADMERLTTPERIDKMNVLKAQRDAEMQKRNEATRIFYATLSDEQKKIFDQQTAKFMQRTRQAQHGSAT